MRRRFRKSGRKRSFKLRGTYRGAAVSAEFTSGSHLSDGEDFVSIQPAVNTTQFVTLLGTTDTNATAVKERAKVKRFSFVGRFGVSELATPQEGQIDWQWWLMVCPAAVASDWQLNARDPNDGTVTSTPSAAPFRIVRKGITTLMSIKDYSTAIPRGTAGFKCIVPDMTIRYPEQLYMFFKPIIVSDGSAGTWQNTEVGLTYNFSMMLHRNNKG